MTVGFGKPPPAGFTKFDDLAQSVRDRYAGVAMQIRKELLDQVVVPDSALGAAAHSLTRIVNLIRGMSNWLLADLLEMHADLRECLYGPTTDLHVGNPEFSILKWLKLSPEDVVALIDKNSLVDLLSNGEDLEPTEWHPLQLLAGVDRLGDASVTSFKESLRRARALGPRLDYRSDDSEMLAKLKTFRRYFGTPGNG